MTKQLQKYNKQNLCNFCYGIESWHYRAAPQAAGAIHSDMERGFIKAEVYTYKELMQYKSELALRDIWKKRQEGKNYVVQDGDVIYFKFNV